MLSSPKNVSCSKIELEQTTAATTATATTYRKNQSINCSTIQSSSFDTKEAVVVEKSTKSDTRLFSNLKTGGYNVRSILKPSVVSCASSVETLSTTNSSIASEVSSSLQIYNSIRAAIETETETETETLPPPPPTTTTTIKESLSTVLSEAIAHHERPMNVSNCIENVINIDISGSSNSDDELAIESVNTNNNNVVVSNFLTTLNQIDVASAISTSSKSKTKSKKQIPLNKQDYMSPHSNSNPSSSAILVLTPKSKTLYGKRESNSELSYDDVDNNNSIEFTVDQMCGGAVPDNDNSSSNFGSSRGLDYLPLFQQHQLEAVSKKKALLFPSDEEKQRNMQNSNQNKNTNNDNMPEVIDIEIFSEHDRMSNNNNNNNNDSNNNDDDSFSKLMEDYLTKTKAARDRKKQKKQKLIDIDKLLDSAAADTVSTGGGDDGDDGEGDIEQQQQQPQHINDVSLGNVATKSISSSSYHSSSSSLSKGKHKSKSKLKSSKSIITTTDIPVKSTNAPTATTPPSNIQQQQQQRQGKGVLKNSHDVMPVFHDIVTNNSNNDIEMGMTTKSSTTTSATSLTIGAGSVVIPISPTKSSRIQSSGTSNVVITQEIEKEQQQQQVQQQSSRTNNAKTQLQVQEERLKRIPRETVVVVLLCIFILTLFLLFL